MLCNSASVKGDDLQDMIGKSALEGRLLGALAYDVCRIGFHVVFEQGSDHFYVPKSAHAILQITGCSHNLSSARASTVNRALHMVHNAHIRLIETEHSITRDQLPGADIAQARGIP